MIFVLLLSGCHMILLHYKQSPVKFDKIENKFSVPLEKVLPFLNNGDLLYCRNKTVGSDCVYDNITNFMGFNSVSGAIGELWSHVAVILRHPKTQELMILSSDDVRYHPTQKKNLLDIHGNENNSGIGIFYFRDYLYKKWPSCSHVGIQFLRKEVPFEKIWNLYTSHRLHLLTYGPTHIGEKVPQFFSLFVSKHIPLLRFISANGEPSYNSMHCAALVGYVYENLGLLKRNRHGHHRYYFPSDFMYPEKEEIDWNVPPDQRLESLIVDVTV